MLPDQADVVIVGAGPTGLTVAGDLAAAGIRTTVLDRRTDESNLTRAFAVHARTLEQLDARGLAAELLATGTTVRQLRLFGSAAIDLGRLPSRYAYLLVTPQYHVERLLRERAERAGARLVSGAEVTGVRQDADGVDVEVAGQRRLRASYVVGADGVHSAVRTAVGLPFPGRAVIQSIMLADVRFTDPPEDVLVANGVGDCFAFVAPFGDGWYRIFAWDRRRPRPDTAPVDLDEVRAVTARALGTDYGMHDARWLSRFHSDERQVPRYRVGRVFLAGDAAHVHSPAGGQGMNTGIQDAVNLGWKLAAAIHGWAGDDLLDTYQAERHPVGRQVLRSSGTIVRLAVARSWPARAARNAAGGTLLRIGPVAEAIAGSLSGVGIRYQAPRGSHRLAGRRATDVPLADDGRLYTALRGGTFVLLASSDAAPVGVAWQGRVKTATSARPGTPTMLVRPDGYIAWASDETDPGRRDDAIRAALRDWCGPVARSTG